MVVFAHAVQPRKVEWLWPGRIPEDAVTLLLGMPGVGKSLLTCDLAGKVSRDGGTVLMLSAEDAWDSVMRPRLEAVQADLERVAFVGIRREGFIEDMQLPDDVLALRALAEHREAKLVVIDPLSAHYGGNVDSLKDQSVRRALSPLRHLAEGLHTAVVALVHLNKGTSFDPVIRALGSIGQMGAARSALLLHYDPDDPEGVRGTSRVMTHEKCNHGPKAGGLRYEIEPILLPDTDIKTARIVHVGESDYTGRDLLASTQADAGSQQTGGGKLQAAKAYLVVTLQDQPREVQAVVSGARRLGISDRTVRRAAEELDVESERIALEGEGRGAAIWTWRLPEMSDAGDE